LPSPSADAAALRSSNGTLFLIGGNNGNVTNQVVTLASGATSWNKAANLDQERTGMGVGFLPGGNIAVYGGMNKSTRLASAISYNPALNNNNITTVTPMSAPRSNHGYATDSSGNLYAIGGLTDSGTTATVEMYSPTSQTWTTLAPLPEPLSDVAATADGGNFIYAFGGTTPSGALSVHAYRYSISANRWDAIAPIANLPVNFTPACASSNAAALGPDDKIFLVCGAYVQAYHIVGDFWTYESVVQAQGHPAVVLDGQGRLVVAGSNLGAQILKTVFISSPVAEPAAAPTFLSTQFFSTLQTDVPFQYRYVVTGSPHPTFSLITKPAGMTIDNVSGLIAWTPTISQIGNNTVTVRATNSFGSTDLTFAMPVVGPIPSAPSAPVASEITETSIRLTWGAVTSPSGPVSYTVSARRAVCSGRGVCGFQVSLTTAATSAVITNLVPGQTRTFYVTATAGGSQSVPSDTVIVTTLQPATPSTLVSTNVTQTSVSLVWQATVSPIPIVGYRLYESGFRIQDNLTALATTVNGLAPGSTHNFEIRAFDASGVESRGSFLTLTTLSPPAISHQNVYVAEQVIAVAGEPMMIIALTTPLLSSAGTDYVVQATGLPVPTFSIVSGPPGLTVDVTTGLVSWTSTGASLGANSVTLRASNSEGVSDLTFNVTGYPAGTDLLVPTAVPTYEGITNITSTGASFTWFAATDNKGVTGYNIYVQTPPTNCFRGGGCSGGPIVKAGVAGPIPSFTITGLLPNTAYAIWFEPFDAAGNVAVARIGQVLPLLRFNTLP
jgi:Galactose oxidase, central domain/Kelch motif/Fibronectin type III domain/Putative Ig domain